MYRLRRDLGNRALYAACSHRWDDSVLTTSTSTRRYQLIGTALVAGGAMLFAMKGLLAKWLYGKGVSFESLVAIRAALALPLFWLFAAHANSIRTVRDAPRTAIAAAAAAGLLCY